MKPIALLEYITFGGMLEYLRRVKLGTPIHGRAYILYNMENLIDFVETTDFTVTQQAIKILKNFKESLEKTPKDRVLSESEKDKLFDIMDKMLLVVQAESKIKFAYFISEKRIDVKKLLNNIESLFAQDVFNVLTDSIQYDIKESGKCIAFECPTASAFHVLRGLEGLLKVLLNKLSPRVDTSHMNWGPLITEIKNLNIPELSILLDNLDRIRANYRNPTNHPEKIYNIEEAQDLFNLGVGVVNDMIGYMKDKGYI